MSRDTVRTFLLWAVLTAVALGLALGFEFLPLRASEEGELIDDAIRLLTIYAIPVFTFVVAVLVYSVVRFRARSGDAPPEDGPPVEGNRGFSLGWLGATSALATLLFVHPGITGLLDLDDTPEPGLVVEVEAVQWHWNIAYPDQELSMEPAEELVLPVDVPVRFEITSRDVIHSLWIPAFRLKQDAVPGRTTAMTATPTEVTGFGEDVGMRAQCAELCGTGHAAMSVPVRVVEQAEFEDWVASMAETAASGDMDDGMDMEGAEGDGGMDMEGG